MRQPKYIVRLTDEQLLLVREILHDSNSNKTRAQILCDADINHGDTYSNQGITKMNRVYPITISNVTRQFINEGLTKILRYNRNEASNHANQKLSGADEAKIMQMVCSEAPQGYSCWSLSLLEKHVAAELSIPVKRDTIGRMLKKETQPHKSVYWAIPPKENAESVAHMEDVLDVYARPYQEKLSVICLDEQPYVVHKVVIEPLKVRNMSPRKESGL